MCFIFPKQGTGLSTLQHVVVETMTNRKCIAKTKYPKENITKTILCARARGKDACEVKN